MWKTILTSTGIMCHLYLLSLSSWLLGNQWRSHVCSGKGCLGCSSRVCSGETQAGGEWCHPKPVGLENFPMHSSGSGLDADTGILLFMLAVWSAFTGRGIASQNTPFKFSKAPRSWNGFLNDLSWKHRWELQPPWHWGSCVVIYSGKI